MICYFFHVISSSHPASRRAKFKIIYDTNMILRLKWKSSCLLDAFFSPPSTSTIHHIAASRPSYNERVCMQQSGKGWWCKRKLAIKIKVSISSWWSARSLLCRRLKARRACLYRRRTDIIQGMGKKGELTRENTIYIHHRPKVRWNWGCWVEL